MAASVNAQEIAKLIVKNYGGIANKEVEVDIRITNVVSTFNVNCPLDLHDIGKNGFNVEYRREANVATMKLQRPYSTALIRSSGHIMCIGTKTEQQAKIAARRYARCLQKMGFPVGFENFRVVNIFGICYMPWNINVRDFAIKYKEVTTYAPELHPGATYRLYDPKATLKIQRSGYISITAPSVANIYDAVMHIYPLVQEFRNTNTTSTSGIRGIMGTCGTSGTNGTSSSRGTNGINGTITTSGTNSICDTNSTSGVSVTSTCTSDTNGINGTITTSGTNGICDTNSTSGVSDTSTFVAAKKRKIQNPSCNGSKNEEQEKCEHIIVNDVSVSEEEHNVDMSNDLLFLDEDDDICSLYGDMKDIIEEIEQKGDLFPEWLS